MWLVIICITCLIFTKGEKDVHTYKGTLFLLIIPDLKIIFSQIMVKVFVLHMFPVHFNPLSLH